MANKLRLSVLEMIGEGKQGHLGGSNSAAEVVAALYFDTMKLDAKDPKFKDRDRFILSKGHAALIQYAALAEIGYIDKTHLKEVKSLGSALQGHPDIRHTPGIEANTGSLGQGLSIACGIALGLRLDKSPARVYVMLGDGELAEGQIWEAAMTASFYGLDGVTAILDRNGFGAMGPINSRFNTNPHGDKWRAFGWHVIEIDGHDTAMVLWALEEAAKTKDKPTIIIANTVKGKGVSFAENTAAFHNGIMTARQLETAIGEVSKWT
ncbi:MAG: transketolase [Defluviitaleaceae bacterium]|nr:transketolase [Defluviitaleaceae bacterium]